MRRVFLAAAAMLGVLASGVLGDRASGTTSPEPGHQTNAVENIERHGWTLAAAGEGTLPPPATVAIIEFSDFNCGYCAGHARVTLPLVMRDYVDTERVGYISGTCQNPQRPLAQMHDL